MKFNKILTIILGIAILSGIVLSGIIIGTGIHKEKNNITNKASIEKPETPEPYVLEKTKLEDFSEASITINYADITIIPSDSYYLEYRLDGTCEEPFCEVSDGKFQFREGSIQRKYQFNASLFGAPLWVPIQFENQEPFYLNLYVPQEQYFEALTIFNDSGNVNLEQLQAKEADLTLYYGNLNLKTFTGEALSLTLDSGNVEYESITCNTLDISNDYGNIAGDILNISDRINMVLDSGNLEFDTISCNKLDIANDYGSVTGTTLTVTDNITMVLDSGNLEFDTISCNTLDLTNEYGNITGDNLTAANKASITLDSGNLDIRQFSTDAFAFTNNYGSTDIACFTAKNGTFSIDSGNLSLMDTDLETVKIKNSYGNVDLELRQDLTEYNYDLFSEYGGIYIGEEKIRQNEDGESSYKKDNQKNRKIAISCESGMITITNK